MNDVLESLDLSQYLPAALSLATNVLLAILILVVGYWIAGRVAHLITGAGARYEQLDGTLFTFLGSIARYLILAFTFVAVLNRFGVETTSIVALLGAAGLAIGLALQGAMTNLAAGVMLLIFRPYKVGDFSEVAGVFGKVVDVNLFTTDLGTFDNQHVIMPNGKIWGEKIVNHSHHGVRGVDMRVGISYGSDIDVARATIGKVLADHPHILADPEPFIEVESLSDSSVDFLVRPFCNGAHYFDVLYSVPEQVKKALDTAGVEIPFPHRKVILFNGEAPGTSVIGA